MSSNRSSRTRRSTRARGIDYESPTSAEGLESYIKIPRLLALPAERRGRVKVYTGHFPYWVCAAVDPALVTMTLLRDPVERSLAALRHFKRDPAYRHLSLDQIYDDRVVFRFYVENHQTKVFGLGPDDNEDAINCGLTIDDARFCRAKENLASVDVLGLTEAYGEFIDEIRASVRVVARRCRRQPARELRAARVGPLRRSFASASRPTTCTTCSCTNTPGS